MLVHQWAESYRDDPVKYDVALTAMKNCVFLDCSDAPVALLDGDAETKNVFPPFQNTAVQLTHLGHPILVFVLQVAAEAFAVFMAVKFPGTGWETAEAVRWGKNGKGEWAAFSPQAEVGVSVFGDHYGVPDPERLVATVRNAAVVWNIFAVMACSNVRTRDHQPDAALNKKRAKAGKVPLVSYKTLEIVVPNTRYEGGGPGGGTHASPRVHLRRGHIRKIADGKTVWVQACVVGSKHGMVLKDYKLRSAA